MAHPISLSSLGGKLADAWRRFPLAVVCIVAFGVALQSGGKMGTPALFFFVSAFWAISAALAAEYGDRPAFNRRNGILAGLAGATVFLSLFVVNLSPYSKLLLAGGVFLFSFTSPFLLRRRTEAQDIAEFCDGYKNAVLLAVLVGGVLFVGIQAILFSLKYLFGLPTSWLLSGRLLLLIAGLLSPLVALGSLPLPGAAAHTEGKSRRIILGYLLVPMLLAYALILHLYIGKIAIAGELPKGNVAYLVFTFAVFGLGSYAAIASLDYRERIFLSFRTLFPFLLLLPAGLLAWGIAERVGAYGITEGRYLLIAGLIWIIACLSAIFLRRGGAAVTLTVFALPAVLLILVGIGPWSAYSVSARSQVARLEALLTEAGLFENGILRPRREDEKIRPELLSEVANIVRYLERSDKRDRLAELLPEGGQQRFLHAANLTSPSGSLHASPDGKTTLRLNFDHGKTTPVSGYDYVVHNLHSAPKNTVNIAEGVWVAQYDKEAFELAITSQDGLEAERIPLGPLLSDIVDSQPHGKDYLPALSHGCYRILLRTLNGTLGEGEARLKNLYFTYHLLIKGAE